MKFNRYNLRGNIDASITKNLTASLNLNADMRDDRKPQWKNDGGNDNLYDMFGCFLQYSPPLVPSHINGLPVGNYVEVNAPEMISPRAGYNNRKYSNFDATVSLEYKVPFVDGLSLKAQYNSYGRHKFTKEFSRPYDMYIFKWTGSNNHLLTDEIESIKTRNDGDYLLERYDLDNNYQLNFFINYSKTFGKHDVSAVLVYEQSEGTVDWFDGRRNLFLSSSIDQMFAGSSDPLDSQVNGGGSEDGRLSYAGRFSYGYSEKYLMEASFRYDGSVRLAPAERWGFFPSGSAAWRISEESFFKDNVSWVSNLKLRGSVGLLGNDIISSSNQWLWMQRYGFSDGAIYGSLSKGISPSAIANPYLTWEKSLSYNAGLDAGFVQNKLTVGLEYFYKHTYDVFGSRGAIVPSTLGADMPNENYGVVDSRGFEVELGFKDKIGDAFNYYVKGNLGYAINKVIEKAEAENLPKYRSEVGYNSDRSRGYIATGLLRTQADLDALLAEMPDYSFWGHKPELGQLVFKDIRGVDSDEPDGKITTEDQDWIINHTTPPVNYGFSLGGNWKGLSLDLFFQGMAGGDLMIGSRARNVSSRPEQSNFDIWTDHWTPENVDAEYPRVYDNYSYDPSTFWRRNSSFLRLKNLNLSYSFPKNLTSKIGIDRLKVFFTGTNLFLLEDHVKIFDPELGSQGDNDRIFPIMKSYSFGINLSF
ncbi:MAG: SusC/RagA family TonB-linked outer membrane protein, partial [Tannerella sp.]|jgi:TonB-linked SusC/RagA family outer membrane protein|nr:SusC/RagA family TonB-linked outer membrane protein [Tannerella sp.]